MEKVHLWCGQPSDRGRLKNRTEHYWLIVFFNFPCSDLSLRSPFVVVFIFVCVFTTYLCAIQPKIK